MTIKSLISVFLLGWILAFGASTTWAQDVPQTAEELVPAEDDTIDSFPGKVQQSAESKGKRDLETAIAQAITQKPTTAATAPAFADRVNTAIADFLPWFQFAVNEIASSDDKTSVTAKFNPIPVGKYGNVSLTTTAAQPQLFKAVEEMIVEPARDVQRKNLLGKVDDFSDLTFGLSYGLQWRAGTWDNTRKLFGRNYELYRNLASDLLNEAISLEDIDRQTDSDNEARLKLLRDHRSVFEAAAAKDGKDLSRFGEIRLSTLRFLAPPDVYAQLIELLRQEGLRSAAVTARVQKAIKDNKLDAIPAMIDNQPQIVLQGSYRESNDIIGRDTAAVTLNYEMGSRNFNAALREYQQMKREGVADVSYLEAFRRGVADRSYRYEDKVIFSASFRRNQRYSFNHDYKESVSVPGSDTPTEIDRTVDLNFPRSDDWRASLSWTRLWPRRSETKTEALLLGLPQIPQMTGRQDPRSTLTIEWVDADQRIKLNDTPIENDRLVARLSLVVPVQGGMTLPLTIVYSDKPEFLKDQDRVLGAHVGISYKIGNKGTAAGQ